MKNWIIAIVIYLSGVIAGYYESHHHTISYINKLNAKYPTVTPLCYTKGDKCADIAVAILGSWIGFLTVGTIELFESHEDYWNKCAN